MGFLAALVALVCLYAPACEAEPCGGFRHLENGRTFFRYGGLLVTFRCHPGYSLHGYKTNSCVSGQWSRDPPVCVGSGCRSPGPIASGTSSVNDDGSWVVFSCNSGFQLRGPSMLYCKGHTWNGSKPECKEYDMMSPVSGDSLQRPIVHQNLQETTLTKTEQKSHPHTLTDAASEEANPTAGLLSHTTSQTSDRERIAVTDPKVRVRQHTLPTVTLAPISLHQSLNPDLSLFGSRKRQQAESGSQNLSVSQSGNTQESTEMSTHTSSSSFTGSPPASSAHDASSSFDTFVASTSSSSRSTESSIITQPHVTPSSTTSNMTGHQNPTVNATSEPPLLSLLLSRQPVCPYPPVPTHGTFYFRNVENPGPRQYKHYIQFACYPGYTLAHGDVRSYCLQGGTWSGVTPVCLELTPCSVDNGGCSQLCFHTHHYNVSSNQAETTTLCHCRPGFALLDDGQTCRDVDECVEVHHQCQHRCFNTFGSFKCGCDGGYQPARDQASCTDVDECLLPVAVTGCVFGCVNTPGSFYCKCPTGYSLQSADSHCQDIDECAVNRGLGPCVERCHNSPGSYQCSCTHGRVLAGDGHSCIAQCPAGYRKQSALPPENSTAQALKEDCVDINECQEDICEWQCVNLPGSHRCICPRGYTVHKDGRRCKDINECAQRNGGCSHLCFNKNGGYKCACPASHRLSPYSWKKCLPRTTENAAG